MRIYVGLCRDVARIFSEVQRRRRGSGGAAPLKICRLLYNDELMH